MSLLLVVDEVLHAGGVCVFRGHPLTGDAVRVVAPRSVVGRPPGVGETWQVEGRWQDHPAHGKQYAATACVPALPTGRLIVQALARSARFPGVGSVRAQRLWQRYGMSLFDLLDAGDASALAPDIGAEQADALVAGWRAQAEEAATFRWLTLYDFEPGLGRKVLELYASLAVPPDADAVARSKGRVIWHLEDDPYRMLAFASWPQVDRAALRMGVRPDDPRRLAGAVEAVLVARIGKAHTWMRADDLVASVARLASIGRTEARDAIRHALDRGGVVAHADGYQPSGCWMMERLVDERCAIMNTPTWRAPQGMLRPDVTLDGVRVALDAHDAADTFHLTVEQRRAVELAMTAGIACVLGGPGVGKTTVLKAVHRVAEAHQVRVVQAALSGRAAQRMAEATSRSASTIARLLLRVEQGEEVLDDEPLLVVDEASMVDLPSLYRLLRALGPGARLLLVGDPGQLPPVGFGLTFHLLAEDERVPRTVLTKVMRQDDASGIPQVCRAIREGVVPDLPDWAENRRSGVSFLRCAPHEVTASIIDLLAALGRHPETQVVGSVKRGAGAVDEINGRLHVLASVGATAVGERFFVGQPVIATRNDYEVDVMNGELGTIMGPAADGALRVRFDAGEKVIPQAYLPDLELAYAITCHKSQGSQFPRVIVPVTPNRLLDRSLLLTAISRAQQQVVLVGDHDAFHAGVTAPPTSLSREVGLGR